MWVEYRIDGDLMLGILISRCFLRSARFEGHMLHYELMASLGGLFLIGVGSVAFHGTLLWSAQLLDELPMIYASCMLISCLIHTVTKRRHGWIIAIVLVMYAGGVTWIYLETRDFGFFVTSYGVQVAVIAAASLYHCISAPTPEHRTQLAKLMVLSLGCYFSGLVLWNIDNAFCPAVRRMRASLPSPLQPLAQLHAWWHVFSAYGTYLSIVMCAYARGAADGFEPVLVADSPIMYVKGTRKSGVAHKAD
jgi:dihydroceramidase